MQVNLSAGFFLNVRVEMLKKVRLKTEGCKNAKNLNGEIYESYLPGGRSWLPHQKLVRPPDWIECDTCSILAF